MTRRSEASRRLQKLAPIVLFNFIKTESYKERSRRKQFKIVERKKKEKSFLIMREIARQKKCKQQKIHSQKHCTYPSAIRCVVDGDTLLFNNERFLFTSWEIGTYILNFGFPSFQQNFCHFS